MLPSQTTTPVLTHGVANTPISIGTPTLSPSSIPILQFTQHDIVQMLIQQQAQLQLIQLQLEQVKHMLFQQQQWLQRASFPSILNSDKENVAPTHPSSDAKGNKVPTRSPLHNLTNCNMATANPLTAPVTSISATNATLHSTSARLSSSKIRKESTRRPHLPQTSNAIQDSAPTLSIGLSPSSLPHTPSAPPTPTASVPSSSPNTPANATFSPPASVVSTPSTTALSISTATTTSPHSLSTASSAHSSSNLPANRQLRRTASPVHPRNFVQPPAEPVSVATPNGSPSFSSTPSIAPRKPAARRSTSTPPAAGRVRDTAPSPIAYAVAATPISAAFVRTATDPPNPPKGDMSTPTNKATALLNKCAAIPRIQHTLSSIFSESSDMTAIEPDALDRKYLDCSTLANVASGAVDMSTESTLYLKAYDLKLQTAASGVAAGSLRQSAASAAAPQSANPTTSSAKPRSPPSSATAAAVADCSESLAVSVSSADDTPVRDDVIDESADVSADNLLEIIRRKNLPKLV